MIRSFADPETERFWKTRRSRKIPSAIQSTALRKLVQLDAARELRDLSGPPGNNLEELSGDRKGQHSIHINGQRRVVFTWKADGPHHVEIVYYH